MIESSSYEELCQILRKRNFFEECLLADVRPVRFGYGIDLVINDGRDGEGRVRNDILERSLLTTIRLLGVESLNFVGALTPAMKEHPERIDWGLSEIAMVDPFQPKEVPLCISVKWEVRRRLDILFYSFCVFS
jgi:hypothetical protein